MSQNNSNDKAAMLAKIEGINKVDGFDPTPFAVDYTDLETGEVRKRLPVMIQMAWFRMKYPEGRIAITVSPGKDCFVATAKVYPSYKDGAECYLAEATASRGYLADKPSVSPREWAQTAAVGIALRNAGFGLQFAIKEQYEMRISEAQLAEEQIRHEIDLYIENGNAPQRWIQEFLDHRNIQSLTRIVAVECIDHIMIYEGKRIEVTFAHMQDYEALVSRVKDYYINQREVG